ncbi:hypothetical protein ACNKHV_19110 [Shigella flexneri]
MVLNDGDNGEHSPYSYRREGFADGQVGGEANPWRFVWMTSPDGKYRIILARNGNTVKTWRWRLLPGE